MRPRGQLIPPVPMTASLPHNLEYAERFDVRVDLGHKEFAGDLLLGLAHRVPDDALGVDVGCNLHGRAQEQKRGIVTLTRLLLGPIFFEPLLPAIYSDACVEQGNASPSVARPSP